MKSVPAVLILVLGASTLAGCSAASPPGSTQAASAAAGSSGTTSAPVNVCAIMPQAAAATAAGMSFSSATERVIAKGVYECMYGTDGYGWSVAVYESPNTENLDDLLGDLGGQSNSKSVSGIGDKAWVSPVGVAAQIGSRLIEVGSANNSADNEAGYEGLAKATIAALK